jgi:hypothetical protein
MRVSTGPDGLPWSDKDAPHPTQSTPRFKLLRREAIQVAPVLAYVGKRVAQASDCVVRVRDDEEHPCPGVSLKSTARARQKVRTELGGRYDQLIDLLRVSIECPTLGAAYAAAHALVAHCGEHNVVRLRDRFAQPEKSGYSDIVANIRMPNGHIAELQIHVTPMLEAKEIEQVLYRERRLIEAGVIPDAHGRLAMLGGASHAIYSTARHAVDEGRGLTGDERFFISSFFPKQP